MDSKEIKDKLNKIAEAEKKHGVLGVGLNASDDAIAEDVLDYVLEIIEDGSQLIKNKSKLRIV